MAGVCTVHLTVSTWAWDVVSRDWSRAAIKTAPPSTALPTHTHDDRCDHLSILHSWSNSTFLASSLSTFPFCTFCCVLFAPPAATGAAADHSCSTCRQAAGHWPLISAHCLCAVNCTKEHLVQQCCSGRGAGGGTRGGWLMEGCVVRTPSLVKTLVFLPFFYLHSRSTFLCRSFFGQDLRKRIDKKPHIFTVYCCTAASKCSVRRLTWSNLGRITLKNRFRSANLLYLGLNTSVFPSDRS